MTDLLEPHTVHTATPTGAASPTTSLKPPLPPPEPSSLRPKRGLVIGLGVVAAAALIVAAVMTVLWVDASGERDDAAAERDAMTATSTDADAAAEQAQADLAAAQRTASQAQADLAALTESAASDQAESDAEVDTLRGQVDDLTAANVDLRAQLDAAQAAADGAASTPTAMPGADFVQYIGELLSSRHGPSLSAAQNQCLGTAVIDTIGLDALGAGLNLGATSAENNAVVGAMLAAVDTCSIPPSALFGG